MAKFYAFACVIVLASFLFALFTHAQFFNPNFGFQPQPHQQQMFLNTNVHPQQFTTFQLPTQPQQHPQQTFHLLHSQHQFGNLNVQQHPAFQTMQFPFPSNIPVTTPTFTSTTTPTNTPVSAAAPTATLSTTPYKAQDKYSPSASFKITAVPDITIPSGNEETTASISTSSSSFSHTLRFGVKRIAWENKQTEYYDIFMIVEPTETSTVNSVITAANANSYQLAFASFHYITPTTVNPITATRVAPKIISMTELKGKNLLTDRFYQVYKASSVYIPNGVGTRFAFTYQFKPATADTNPNNLKIDYSAFNDVFESPTFYQETTGVMGSFGWTPELLALTVTLKNLNSTGVTKPVTNTQDLVNSVEDYRTLVTGSWVSTGTCTTSASCCCLNPTKPITVLLPEQVLNGNYPQFTISDEDKEIIDENTIFVHSYLDSSTSCFNIPSLSGICQLDKSTLSGTCTMQGIKMTAKIDGNQELVISNSMYKNCESTARKQP